MLPLLPEDFLDRESVIPSGGFGFFLARLPGMPGIEIVQFEFGPEGPTNLARNAIVAQVGHGNEVGDDPLGELPVVERQRRLLSVKSVKSVVDLPFIGALVRPPHASNQV